MLAGTRERVRELDRSIARGPPAPRRRGHRRRLARAVAPAGARPAPPGRGRALGAPQQRLPRAGRRGGVLDARGRAAALAAGVTAWSLRSVDAGVSQAELLLSKSEFADATRMFLEARDAFDRSRRDGARARGRRRRRRAARPWARPSPSRDAALAAGRDAGADRVPGRTAHPPRRRAGRDAPSRPAASMADATSVATPSAGGVEGFDSSDVSSRRPPQFAGRMEFEVLPPAVRPGEPFVVRIHLRNDGRRAGQDPGRVPRRRRGRAPRSRRR